MVRDPAAFGHLDGQLRVRDALDDGDIALGSAAIAAAGGIPLKNCELLQDLCLFGFFSNLDCLFAQAKSFCAKHSSFPIVVRLGAVRTDGVGVTFNGLGRCPFVCATRSRW